MLVTKSYGNIVRSIEFVKCLVTWRTGVVPSAKIHTNVFPVPCFKNDPGVQSISYPAGTFNSPSGKEADRKSDSYLYLVQWLGLFGIHLFVSFAYRNGVVCNRRFFLEKLKSQFHLISVIDRHRHQTYYSFILV